MDVDAISEYEDSIPSIPSIDDVDLLPVEFDNSRMMSSMSSFGHLFDYDAIPDEAQ